MLILSRRKGEAIRIDKNIHLTILDVQGKQVRIGITAPDDVDVHREEIFQRIKRQEQGDNDATK